MLKYAEDFKYNPSLRSKVSELRLAVKQDGEEEMLAMVDLDQWYGCLYVVLACVCHCACACMRMCIHAFVRVCVCVLVCVLVHVCISV